MTVLKTPHKYWIERSFTGRPGHLCHSCSLLGKCTKDGVYRQRGVLGKPEWEVVGCSEYTTLTVSRGTVSRNRDRGEK